MKLILNFVGYILAACGMFFVLKWCFGSPEYKPPVKYIVYQLTDDYYSTMDVYCDKHGVMRIPSGRVIRPVFNKHGENIMCEVIKDE